MNDIYLKYYKWGKKDQKRLIQSCKEYLNINNIQFYKPFFSLYFNIHNTKNSHKRIDINRNVFLIEILNVITQKYYTSNSIMICKLFNKSKNYTYNEEVFCKCIPLLDPMYFMMNNYNLNIKRNPILPSAFNYNTFKKINDIDNSAYIDTFFSFICSEITIQNINPSFPLFYGSVNGIKENFNYDISDDYDTLKNEYWFQKNLGNNYSLDIYVSSSDDEEYSSSDDEDCPSSDDENLPSSDDEDRPSSDNSSISDTSNSSDEENNSDDCIALLKNIPCEFFFIEKLEGTLEDLLEENFNKDIILSCIFQISFALCYLQKHYQFSHNDLHINNIMFKKTDRIYLYYKYNNIYFKVPTHGYLFKIIDFGRCIFTFKNRLFYNDAFHKHGEAQGQFKDPYKYLNYNDNKNNFKLNYNFDLCRLAITILEVCCYDKTKDYNDKTEFYNFLYHMTLDNNNNSFLNLEDDFNMYILISKYSCNSKPSTIIQNDIFNKYRIKKKNFPKKLFYKL